MKAENTITKTESSLSLFLCCLHSYVQEESWLKVVPDQGFQLFTTQMFHVEQFKKNLEYVV